MGLFGKKKDTKVAASVYPRKLTGMLVNLKKIQVELFGDQKEDEKNVEMKKLDEYGKAKYQLNELLTVIRNEHAQLEAYQGIDEKRRDFKSIKMQEENYKRLQMATSKWDQLKQHLAKDEQKKKLTPESASDRKRQLRLLGEELKLLAQKCSKKSRPANADDQMIIHLQQKRDADRQEREVRNLKRQKERRVRRKKGHQEAEIKGLKEVEVNTPISLEEQAFYDKVDSNIVEQDELLDLISSGLDELKNLADSMNKDLNAHSTLLEEVKVNLDGQTSNMKTANERLEEVLERTGGVTRWCPRIIGLIILLALAGYLFQLLN